MVLETGTHVHTRSHTLGSWILTWYLFVVYLQNIVGGRGMHFRSLSKVPVHISPLSLATLSPCSPKPSHHHPSSIMFAERQLGCMSVGGEDPVNYADSGSYIINYSGPSCGPAWAASCAFWFSPFRDSQQPELLSHVFTELLFLICNAPSHLSLLDTHFDQHTDSKLTVTFSGPFSPSQV